MAVTTTVKLATNFFTKIQRLGFRVLKIGNILIVRVFYVGVFFVAQNKVRLARKIKLRTVKFRRLVKSKHFIANVYKIYDRRQ